MRWLTGWAANSAPFSQGMVMRLRAPDLSLPFRRLLAAAFISVAIVPVLFLGVWVQRSSFETEMAAVHEKHLLLASNMTAALERYSLDVEAAFEVFADAAASGRFLDSMTSLAQQLGFQHFCLVDEAGRAYNQVSLDGETVDALSPRVLRQVLSLAEDGRLFSPVLADPAGRPAILLVRRLDDGTFAVGRISTDYLVRLQQAIAFGRKGHAAIVDHQGNVLAHPNPDWQRQMKNLAKVDPVRRMMSGETGVTTFFSPAMQKEMVSGFTTVPGVGWGVMVPQPIEELEERAQAFQRAAFTVMLVGLIVAGILSWFVSGLLMRPIDAVVAATRKIAGGQLTARVADGSPSAPPEFRELARSFNTMAARLEDDQKVMAAALSEARLADRTKSEFLANMSHEFRTPLNAIIGFSELMKREVRGPLGNTHYVDYAGDILLSGQHLLAIINDVLDLSKIEAGKMTVKDDDFEIAAMIDESLIMVRRRTAETELDVDVNIEPGLPRLRADKVKLKQILINLLANAVRFTPDYGQISLKAYRADDNGVVIQVCDTGIGMTPGEMELAVKPFAQVDSRLSRKFEGTGLGLPLSKRLIELHGGSLKLDSRPGYGTTVSLYLPAERTVVARAAE